MTNHIDVKSIVGSIMPNVFVDQIKLESMGGSVPARDNPHIDVSIEGSAAMESGATSAARALKVTVQISLKDSPSKDAVNSWFKKNKFVNYLSYVVICSTDEFVTNTLLTNDDQGNRSHLIGAVASSGKLVGNLEQNIINSLVNYYVGPAKRSLVEKNLKVRSGKVNEAIDLDEQQMTPLVQVDDNGREIYNFPLSVTFEGSGMENSKPKHLTIFAYSLFEIDKYFEDIVGGGALLNNLKALSDMGIGKVTVQQAIKNFQVIRESVIFRRQDTDEIYMGPYHAMANGALMAGTNHAEGQPMLYSEVVPNTMVQDFRNFEELVPNVLDLSSFQKDLLPSTNRFFTEFVKDNLENKDKTNYFSDIWISRGLKGECKFAFAVDLIKIIKENTKYSWLLEEDPTLIQRYFKILSFKIFRRRVQRTRKKSKDFVLFDSGFYNKSIGAKMPTDLFFDMPDLIIETSQEPNTANIRESSGTNSV